LSFIVFLLSFTTLFKLRIFLFSFPLVYIMSEIASHYPQGMGSYNNRTYIGGYETWKGTGQYSNPVAITAGNIRPLTNKDYTNVTVSKPGLARPQKWQYRKGTVTNPRQTIIVNPENPSQYITVNTNRESRSSKSYSLIGQLIDRPGQFSVKHNPSDELNGTDQLNKDCTTCTGIGIVTDYYPEPFLTNNPEPVSTNTPYSRPNSVCCNEAKKALLRVRPASTNLKKNYYTTLEQYRQNRCQTYDQKAFNFYSASQATANAEILKNNPQITEQMLLAAKPGSALAISNTYIANCYPNTGNDSQYDLVIQAFEITNNAGLFSQSDIANYYSQHIQTLQQYILFIQSITQSVQALILFKQFIENPYYGMALSGPSNPRGCKLTVYKPSNSQFAVEGGVSSSARTFKLSVATVEKDTYNTNKFKGSGSRKTIPNVGGQPFTPFIYKNKVEKCNPSLPIMFRQVSYNPKTCFRNSDDYFYKNVTNLGSVSVGPTVANNGISASIPGGQPIR